MPVLVDLIFLAIAIISIFVGYRRGFLQTVFRTVGYIGGGVLGLLLALHFFASVHNQITRFAIIILSIFLVAELGRRVLGAISKVFRAKILWPPLRFIDSLAGVVLECVRAMIVSYLIVALVLWSPWTGARKVAAESTIYPKLNKQMPHLITQLRTEIEKKLSINLPK